MDSITRQFGLLCLGALAAALTACASNDVTLCEKSGILCPAGTHCAGIEAVCIQDSNLCGNGQMDPGEVCDDGNTQDGDTCSRDCKSDLSCGNTITDVGALVPEQCDDGPNNGKIGSPCSATCQLVKCGNHVVEQGEQCDDSNITSGDGCSSTCQREFCGNGHIDKEAGEVCDDGDKNGTPGDPCSANCRSNLSCDNGIVDPGEECDHGKLGSGNQTGNDNSNDCRSDCQFNQCGDGFTDTQLGQRQEQCDAGHLTQDDTFHQLIPVPTEAADCNIDCTLPTCGDGKVNRHFMPDGTHTEQCDSGTVSGVNQNKDTAVCTATCQLNVCGDGHPWAGVEPCDDGGVNTGNCNANCTKPTCGDGIVNAQFMPDGAHTEQCDNGTVTGVNQNQDTTACTSTCQINVCGDHHVLAGIEACDRGGVDAADCDFDCTKPVCGDGHRNETAGEACDDGDKNGTAASPTHCNQFCQINTCGNGVVDQGEDCDAGSGGVKANSAACDDNCTFAKCGDGFPNPVAGEACDEGAANGTLAGPTHCNQFCQFNSCGNGILEPGEQCDDGKDSAGQSKNKAGARCNATCQLNVCGDGDKLENVEQCDPGHDEHGPVDTALCDHDCTLPVCGDGVPNTLADEQCDEGRLLNGLPGHCDARCKSPLCGNGVIDVNVAPLPDEQCDDGDGVNPKDSARCNKDCTLARCGDGQVNPLFKPDGANPEFCDNIDPITHASLNGVPCAYGDPNCMRCNATCTGNVNPGGPFCGDGLTQSNEGCDPITGPALILPSPLARADSATCDIDCTPATCGDGYRNDVAHETCEDGNQLACGTCASITATDCRGMTPITPTQATSMITTINGDLIGDLNTLKLDDGFGKTITLEFDLTALQDPNNVSISFAQAPATDAATIASRMVDAINTKAPAGFLITASVPMGGTTITLTNTRKSVFGNTPITVTGLIGAANGFVFNPSPPKMAGGLAGDCLVGTGCVVGDDCKSGVCSATTHQCQ